LDSPKRRELFISEEDLRRCDGLDGRPAYVALHGIVYDVTKSWHWKNGIHWALHQAGHDLTEEIADAPHTAEMLRGFPIIGRLKTN